jgi:peptide deformylase
VPVREIVQYPHPVLKQRCEPIDPTSETARSLAEDLLDTLNEGPGVGIAAPQINEPYRVIVVDAARNPRRSGQGCFTLFNPELIEASGQRFGREGCLSIPEFTGNVVRSERVVVCGFLLGGEEIRIEASDYEAVVFQHELDHLDGILFLDRITNPKRHLFRRQPQQ